MAATLIHNFRLYLNNHFSKAIYIEMGRKYRSVWVFLGRAVVGIGGAFAAILGGSWIGKISYINSTENIVNLSSLCVVAGTVADSLMPGIGRRLQDEFFKNRVKNLEKTSKENNAQVQEKIKQTEQEQLQLKEYATAISYAETALGRKDGIDIEPAIEALKSVEPYFPTERTLHIYLGRLFKRLEQYDQAILILRKFIQNLEAVPASSKVVRDKADAYYNIACYHAVKAAKRRAEGNLSAIERLETEAIEALQLAIAGNPKNKENARTDDDFDGMREKVGQFIGI